MKTGQRITMDQSLCTSTSPPSNPQIVTADPAIPKTSVDPVFPGADRVVVRAAVGGGPVLDGANLTVTADFGAPPTKKVGGQPSPGGVQEVLINPHAPTGTHKFSSFQALCKKGAPGPTTTESPCSDLPAAQIRPPQVGDTEVQVTVFVPGSEILLFVSSGGAAGNWSRRRLDCRSDAADQERGDRDGRASRRRLPLTGSFHRGGRLQRLRSRRLLRRLAGLWP